jgi:hypothetical protein
MLNEFPSQRLDRSSRCFMCVELLENWIVLEGEGIQGYTYQSGDLT